MGRSILDVVSSLVVSVLAFLVALLLVDGVAWPVVSGVFCGLAAAMVLNATDVMAWWSRRSRTGGEGHTGGRDDQRAHSRSHLINVW